MNCPLPIGGDPKYFDYVKLVFVREDVRLVKGEGAVEKFDKLDPDRKLDLHPELEERIDEVIEAMRVGGVVPGVWQDPVTSECHQDWITLACYARWYHAVDEEARKKSRNQLMAGSREPWANIDDYEPPMACAPESESTSCCPQQTYSDSTYFENPIEDSQAGFDFPWGALLAITAGAAGGWFVVPKVLEKLK